VARVLERRHRVLVVVGVDAETEVVDGTGAAALAALIRRPVVADEEGQNATVAGVEEQVRLRGVVEVGLAEHQRHPEQVLVELDRIGLVAPQMVM